MKMSNKGILKIFKSSQLVSQERQFTEQRQKAWLYYQQITIQSLFEKTLEDFCVSKLSPFYMFFYSASTSSSITNLPYFKVLHTESWCPKNSQSLVSLKFISLIHYCIKILTRLTWPLMWPLGVYQHTYIHTYNLVGTFTIQ